MVALSCNKESEVSVVGLAEGYRDGIKHLVSSDFSLSYVNVGYQPEDPRILAKKIQVGKKKT